MGTGVMHGSTFTRSIDAKRIEDMLDAGIKLIKSLDRLLTTIDAGIMELREIVKAEVSARNRGARG